MRCLLSLRLLAFLAASGLTTSGSAADAATAAPPTGPATPEARTIAAIYGEALARGHAYDQLRTLVEKYPGRLCGTTNLQGAIEWARETLGTLQLDRVYTQEVTVPHWERGEPESAILLHANGVVPLAVCALGGSGASGPGGVLADVVEVKSLDELVALGQARVEGKVVFFNRPMEPTTFRAGTAYGGAADQRTRGPAAAAKLGAVAAVVRSLTFLTDDLPHTGVTVFPPGVTPIPALAVSTKGADALSAALADARREGRSVRMGLKVASRWLPDTLSHNVIGEIRGREHPDRIIVVGGHIDSWDIAPGAHDDGAGVVQAMEVLRLFRVLGLKPSHTLRCVLFTNEENGLRGAAAYAAAAKEAGEKHVLALESDGGGFDPRGFDLGSTQGDAAAKAARWLPLFKPYGIADILTGRGGMDVVPLMAQGCTVGEITPNSQRYFDIHHTRADTIDKVNPRELHLGAAALASLVWLVDTQGL